MKTSKSKKIAASELLLNADGSIYHLNLRPEELADTVILVGDPGRVAMIAKHMTAIEFTKQSLEFVSTTGLYKGKRITVLSTGIGTDNIDIVMNELDAVANIDFNTRKIKEQKRSLTLVRIGTSGALQPEIPLGSFVLSHYSIGCDGLVNWYANRDILPGGIKGLSEKVEALGMKFGLWFEPEMVNPDSDLYRAHPDWVLSVPGRPRSLSRHQCILDFSRPEVVDHIHDMMYRILKESKISYIKWDMNRSMSECWSAALPADRQGETAHRYILGVYDLYRRLTTEFPMVLFESCAGGGARFDPGMLAYAPQAWCSDDTDAMERVKIQYGTSYCYPISSIGSHVSSLKQLEQQFRQPDMKSVTLTPGPSAIS